MKQLLITTADQKTFDELSALIDDDDIHTVARWEVGLETPDRSGATFAQIAMDEVDHAARTSGLVSVGESSGLVVDALDGAPGVFSAEFAGPDATDHDNRQLLLQRLEHTPTTDRSARLDCVIGVAHPDGRLRTFESTLEGVIADAERGVGGLDYDPVFELEDGMTIAELWPEDRSDVLPRDLALKKALPYIHELLGNEA